MPQAQPNFRLLLKKPLLLCNAVGSRALLSVLPSVVVFLSFAAITVLLLSALTPSTLVAGAKN
jgi:hypothetical protein